MWLKELVSSVCTRPRRKPMVVVVKWRYMKCSRVSGLVIFHSAYTPQFTPTMPHSRRDSGVAVACFQYRWNWLWVASQKPTSRSARKACGVVTCAASFHQHPADPTAATDAAAAIAGRLNAGARPLAARAADSGAAPSRRTAKRSISKVRIVRVNLLLADRCWARRVAARALWHPRRARRRASAVAPALAQVFAQQLRRLL